MTKHRHGQKELYCQMVVEMKGKTVILIVDENEADRERLKEILLEEYDVVQASNGSEALEKLKEPNTISAIILDLRMPVMDGYEF